jgi:two-component system chemotaxis response regulator CheY
VKTLIVEDDFTSRLLMQELLRSYGSSHIAVNGEEAIDAVRSALDSGEPYDLICLDIMMPEMDGHAALREIRTLEASRGITSTHGAKIIMTTAVDDAQNIMRAFYELCDAYIFKPIEKAKLLHELENIGLTLVG